MKKRMKPSTLSLVMLLPLFVVVGCMDEGSSLSGLVGKRNSGSQINRGGVTPGSVTRVPGNNPRKPIPGPALDGAAPFDSAPTRDRRIDDDFVPFSQETDEILLDLAKVERDDADEVPFTRYVSVGFMDYLDYPDEAARISDKIAMIDSLSILTNSLSRNDFISKPVAVNKRMSVFRIDIRDYNWTQAQWENLISGDANEPDKKAYPYNNDFDANVQSIAQKIGTQVPIIRGDWMLFEGGKPFVYHDLSDIDVQLSTVEQSIGVDREDNIRRTIDDPKDEPRAIRSLLGAGNSGVSTNNRIVERHESNDGAYWLSYDFPAVDGLAERDVLQSPLGPGALGDGVGGSQLQGFVPAGGEVIFNMENGLQGYMLLDENFGRVDDAPTNVVFNPTDRLRGGVIENGYICWSCHTNGILKAQDELRPFMDNLSERDRDEIYNDDVVDAVKAMHVPQDKLDQLISKDSQVYQNALSKALMISKEIPGQIASLASYYEFDMSFDMVASELNVTTEQLNRSFDLLSTPLRTALQAARSGKLQRDNFETLFPQLVEELFDLQQAPIQ